MDGGGLPSMHPTPEIHFDMFEECSTEKKKLSFEVLWIIYDDILAQDKHKKIQTLTFNKLVLTHRDVINSFCGRH